MTDKEMKILVVDDEADIRKILRLLLQKQGYTVCEATNGADVAKIVKGGGIGLVIMDIMMPKMNGVEAVAQIRSFSNIPVLFLTARSLDTDKEAAYLSGGDDYLVKPFSAKELLLKVESLLRRYMIYEGKNKGEGRVLSLACGIEVELDTKTVRKNGETVSLRDKESDIFFYLLDRRGDTVSSGEIFEAVWAEKVLPSSANNVMVNMLNLRKKLEDDHQSPKLIKTVWGKGYRFE